MPPMPWLDLCCLRFIVRIFKTDCLLLQKSWLCKPQLQTREAANDQLIYLLPAYQYWLDDAGAKAE